MDPSAEWLICNYCKRNFHGKDKLHAHKKDKHMDKIRAAVNKRKIQDIRLAATTNKKPVTNIVSPKIRVTTIVTPTARKRQKLQDLSDSSSSSDDEVEYSKLGKTKNFSKSHNTNKTVQSNLNFSAVSKSSTLNPPFKIRIPNSRTNVNNIFESKETSLPRICTVLPAPLQTVSKPTKPPTTAAVEPLSIITVPSHHHNVTPPQPPVSLPTRAPIIDAQDKQQCHDSPKPSNQTTVQDSPRRQRKLKLLEKLKQSEIQHQEKETISTISATEHETYLDQLKTSYQQHKTVQPTIANVISKPSNLSQDIIYTDQSHVLPHQLVEDEIPPRPNSQQQQQLIPHETVGATVQNRQLNQTQPYVSQQLNQPRNLNQQITRHPNPQLNPHPTAKQQLNQSSNVYSVSNPNQIRNVPQQIIRHSYQELIEPCTVSQQIIRPCNQQLNQIRQQLIHRSNQELIQPRAVNQNLIRYPDQQLSRPRILNYQVIRHSDQQLSQPSTVNQQIIRNPDQQLSQPSTVNQPRAVNQQIIRHSNQPLIQPRYVHEQSNRPPNSSQQLNQTPMLNPQHSKANQQLNFQVRSSQIAHGNKNYTQTEFVNSTSEPIVEFEPAIQDQIKAILEMRYKNYPTFSQGRSPPPPFCDNSATITIHPQQQRPDSSSSFPTLIPSTANNNNETRWPCPSCRRVFKTDKGLKVHSRVHQVRFIVPPPTNIATSVHETMCVTPKVLVNEETRKSVDNQRHSPSLTPPVIPVTKTSLPSTSQSEVKTSVPRGSIPQNYQCAICNIYFVTMPGMQRHMKQHDNVVLKVAFGCSICKARFEHESERNEHLKLHITQLNAVVIPETSIPVPPPLASDKCNNDMVIVDLSLAETENAGVSNDGQQKESSGSTEFSQDNSNQSTVNVNINVAALVEKVYHEMEKEQPSEDSGTGTETGTSKSPAMVEEPIINDDQNDDDKIDESVTDDGEPLRCYICSDFFQNVQGLYKHIFDAHTEKTDNISCTVCTKTFDSEDALENHTATHHVKICDDCKKCFTTTFDLTLHRRQEHNVKEIFACSTCRMGFHQSIGLVMHQKITGHH